MIKINILSIGRINNSGGTQNIEKVGICYWHWALTTETNTLKYIIISNAITGIYN